MQSHRFCRLHDFLVGGAYLAVADILLDRSLEEPGILEHHAEEVVYVLAGEGGDIHAVHVDLAAIGFVKTHQEVYHGGLARARRTHDRDLLSREGVRREAVHDLAVRVVAETHVVKDHVAARHRELRRLAALVRELLVFQKFKDSFARRRSGLEGGEGICEGGQRIDKEIDVHDKGDDHAETDLARESERAAEDSHRHEPEVAHEAHQRHHHARHKLGVSARDAKLRVDLIKCSLFLFFAAVRLDHVMRAVYLLDPAVDLAQFLLLTDKVFLRALDDRPDGEKADQRHSYRRERHDIIGHEHHHDGAHELHDRSDQIAHAFIHRDLDEVHVVGGAGESVAVTRRIEI